MFSLHTALENSPLLRSQDFSKTKAQTAAARRTHKNNNKKRNKNGKRSQQIAAIYMSIIALPPLLSLCFFSPLILPIFGIFFFFSVPESLGRCA